MLDMETDRILGTRIVLGGAVGFTSMSALMLGLSAIEGQLLFELSFQEIKIAYVLVPLAVMGADRLYLNKIRKGNSARSLDEGA
jgi:hypothetical protein